MELFKSFGGSLSYSDIIQCDGAFAVVHTNYGKSPCFNNKPANELEVDFTKSKSLTYGKMEDLWQHLTVFDGTSIYYSHKDKLILWEAFFVEYTNSFSKLIEILPKSITTVYIGRHVIELGFKYMLMKKGKKFGNTI